MTKEFEMVTVEFIKQGDRIRLTNSYDERLWVVDMVTVQSTGDRELWISREPPNKNFEYSVLIMVKDAWVFREKA